jgi:hypothetical protein
MTFDQIKRVEPELARMEAHIKQIGRKRGQNFCANGLWTCYFHPAMCGLVGWEATRPELRSSQAYNVANRHLYNLLPHCKHDHRVCG